MSVLWEPPKIDPTDDIQVQRRMLIHEWMGTASIHCGLVQAYAELADDVGLEYAIKRFLAYARVVRSTFNDLAAQERGGKP